MTFLLCSCSRSYMYLPSACVCVCVSYKICIYAPFNLFFLTLAHSPCLVTKRCALLEHLFLISCIICPNFYTFSIFKIWRGPAWLICTCFKEHFKDLVSRNLYSYVGYQEESVLLVEFTAPGEIFKSACVRLFFFIKSTQTLHWIHERVKSSD